MSKYPQRLVREHELYDGRRVLIRPIRDDDGVLEEEFVRGLSGESRYMRFQKWVNAPSQKLIHYLTHVDYDRHLALVCVVRDGPRERIVGEARYCVNPDGRTCEFAVVIADDWHKSGIAGLLMTTLIRAATEHGLVAMESQVLTWNSDMLRFAHGLGFEVEHMPDDITMLRIVKKLQPATRPAHRLNPQVR